LVKRLFVLGLDATPPSLLFDKFIGELPNFKRLLDRSVYGRLRSCDPPITVPAWMVMFTGKTPGDLGIYGFRNRVEGSYNDYSIPSSRDIKYVKIWELIARRGYKSAVVGVPPTYPPQPLNGWMISGFLTPSDKSRFTYPSSLKYEVKSIVDRYVFDVVFRREDREAVYNELVDMTVNRLKVIDYLLDTKPWNLFIYMEIGVDRVQHAFWKYFDEEHPRHTPHREFSGAILNYYKLLDDWLGTFLRRFGKDTTIMVVSDHGAKYMKGAFAVNDWLIEKGYMALKGDVRPGTRMGEAPVDWNNTYVWGWGGYYARIFFNVEGREKNGIISREEYPDFVKQFIKDVMSIRGPGGETWRNVVHIPSELYRRVNGNPPDLMVYFDDLYWRSAGTLGYGNYYLPENDTGPDDSVHDYHGVYVYSEPGMRNRGQYEDLSIYDIYPTIAEFFGISMDELSGLYGESFLNEVR